MWTETDWGSYTVNYAAVMGIFDDANIDGNQFSYLAMAFYVSYLVFELPTGYLMQRLPLAKYLGANGQSCHNGFFSVRCRCYGY